MATDEELNQNAAFYEAMEAEWARAECLLGGTDAMREAGTAYLPKFPGESDDVHRWRLSVATLDNFYEAIAEQMAGLIFGETLKFEGDGKSAIPDEILNNIDKRGSTLHTFAVNLVLRMLTKGLAHVQVEYPRNPGAQTLRDDKEMGLRPYWIDRSTESVFSAFADIRDGNDRLLQVRIRESFATLDGLAILNKERIRVLHLRDGKAEFEVYEKSVQKMQDKEVITWKVVESGALKGAKGPLAEIPFVTGYAKRRGFMLSKPTLSDVAHKNVEHWQSAADQRHILTVTRFPTMVQAGIKEAVSHLGPYNLIHTATEADKVRIEYVESEGFGIEAGEKDMARIKGEAEAMAVRIVTASAPKTDRGEALDAQREGAPLMRIASEAERVINRCLELTAIYLGIDPKAAGRVRVNRDFGVSAEDAKAIETLIKMREAGEITRLTLWQECIERGFFKTSFDVEKEQAALDKEEAERLDKQVAMFAPKGGGDDGENVDDDGNPIPPKNASPPESSDG